VAEQRHVAEKTARLEALKPIIALADDLEDGRGGFRDSVASDLRNGILPTPRGIEIVIEILGAPAVAAFKAVDALDRRRCAG